ncbi:ATP-binding protein [Helicobacter pylori]|uniref:FtsK/SpoIIIE domain-containing protein n=1 Tax=Helicobacter pylori TaxID=210 RepID=UPI000BEB79AB|nr:FtsK/SpoIIIE domain-containing protein [Helicobacter pylori]PDW99378.1 ATP-binding protein [Helicobacter pylori]
MTDAGNLLKELDDALDRVIAKKEPESFLKPIILQIEDYQKSIRQIQVQFTDVPQFNEAGAYPQFLSCGLLEIKGKNGANMEFLLPKVYPFPPKSLYIEHEKDGQFLREMLMRLLSSAPLVQLEIVLVDALSLGGIFNLARRLLDKDNDFIYQQRILTESKEIEESLKHLYEYLKVNLQEKLAGFRDFAHYNEEAKDRLPLKVLFLSGVDALSQNALYYLEKIMRFGSKNGVLSFVNLESEKNNQSAEDLKKHAEFFKDTTSFERFKYLNVEVINDQGIKSQHMQDFADKIKAYCEKKKAVKSELKALQKDEKFWTESSQYEVVVPVGWGINHKEVRFEIGELQNHTLICDHSGSGKSNFLHVLIQNLAFYYAPNEVQLFLLDYKEGVEFNAYTDPILEHARLVSVASSVGFGMSFLRWLCDEIKKRSELFKQFKVKDLSDYRKHEKMPNILKANEMRLHLGKKVDYEQKDLIVEFESNESHLLVVSQDLNARIALMKLLFQNVKSANKELVFCNKEKRLIRFFDAQKEYGITPIENALNALDTTTNRPNSALVIDNLNEAKEWHDKVGAEKLKSFLEKATDNEQYCVIFAHDYKQIKTNYHLDKLRELLSNHFKQCLAFRCNGENLSALKSEQKLHELNARLINTSKDSYTEFRPFSL